MRQRVTAAVCGAAGSRAAPPPPPPRRPGCGRDGRVAEFMYHNIFLCGQRRHTQPAAESQRAGFQAAGTPPGVHIPHRNAGKSTPRAAGRKPGIVCPAKGRHLRQGFRLGGQRRVGGCIPPGVLRRTGPGRCHPPGAGGHKGIHHRRRHPRRRAGRHRPVRPHPQVDVAHPAAGEGILHPRGPAVFGFGCAHRSSPRFPARYALIVHASGAKCNRGLRCPAPPGCTAAASGCTRP